MAKTRNHCDTELSRRDVLLIATINNQTVALHRLRQAAFGLDGQDRIEIAERLSALHDSRHRPAVKRTPRGRRVSRSAAGAT